MNKGEMQQHGIEVSKDWVPQDYASHVDESILNVPYQPDTFQKQAFYFLSKHNSVFVSAHTSSGKTLVAEYAISKSIKNGTRTIYTSPIKALSNQKFYDFKQKYDCVGIMTGDVQVNPTAQCLIMTTEILRNMLYKNSEIMQNTEYVVFDEVHYINDQERGVVWEEAIMMLPRRVALIMLSATIPNAVEFCEWVGRTRKECVYVISTTKRAVPLEFAVYHNSEAFSIEEKERGGSLDSNFPTKLTVFSGKAGRSIFRINDLANFIINRGLLPSIFFCFSKRMCGNYGLALETLNLTTIAEKREIDKFIDAALSQISEEDKHLPQILKMKEQVRKGVAVHHSGLLPIVREVVEILFSNNFIKILLATETFAVGVNMLAKCCVFLGITKIDSGRFRTLTGGEFIQMSGRAGRRGKDKVGTVIIAGNKLPDIEVVRQLVHGKADNLGSKFRLSFSLILNALKSNLDVEELMKKSFRENTVQKSFFADMKRLQELEREERLRCDVCSNMGEFLRCLKVIVSNGPEILKNSIMPGKKYILRNNTRVICKEVDATGKLLVDDWQGKLRDPLFSKLSNSNYNTTPEYMSLPPTLYKGGGSQKVDPKELILEIEDDKVNFCGMSGDMQLFTLKQEVSTAYDRLKKAAALNCPLFEHHYEKGIEEEKKNREINLIRNRHSKSNLRDLMEYAARCNYLRDKGFVDEQGVTLKGKIAAEIRTVNEILTTEMIFKNVLKDFKPSEISTIFSALISEEPLDEEKELEENIKDSIKVLEDMHEKHTEELRERGIPVTSFVNHGMTNAVYGWCCGESLGVLVAKYDFQEGSFVRLILRLAECCKELTEVAATIGDSVLERKFNEVSEIIKRGVVFTPSLYL